MTYCQILYLGACLKKNHIQAANSVLGIKRKRVYLGLDITRFFEQVSEGRIFNFFYRKCGCSFQMSKLFAGICCVPLGPKNSGHSDKFLARGFATSPRLSIWCNLNIFMKINYKIKHLLLKNDLRLAIYIDDICISASRIDKKQMEEISLIVEDILSNFDPNQKLLINTAKKKIKSYTENFEHLGLRLGRNKLSIGGEVRSRRDKIRNALKSKKASMERNKLLDKNRAYSRYVRQVKVNNKKIN